jgi:chemotaxis protein histidine kinase CheA/ActR/RegA family two-component response regulator
MSNAFDKLSVLDSFIEEVNSYLPEIETNLERLAQSPGDMDALEETYRRTHTIGGSASMMDFPGLAHVAHGMEDILGDAIDGLITIDEPALGLLQRSSARLHQLLEGIRSGIDEEAVIAEDDADYTRYRAIIDSSIPVQGSGKIQAVNVAQHQAADQFQPLEALEPRSSATPSFDEVLASFRTPSVGPGEDVAWPEEPALPFDDATLHPPPNGAQYDGKEAFVSEELEQPTSSALEALVASTRRSSPANEQPSQVDTSSVPIPPPSLSELFSPELDEYAVLPTMQPVNEDQAQSNMEQIARSEVESMVPVVREELRPAAYDTMQRGTQALEEQTSGLKSVVEQLRKAMAVIEEQRSEFKGFLNGSKDALDRMEEWAGKAMGLNLRNSPEQVRRYLPLSVMWVSNSRLKSVLDLIQKITSGVELTEEQMNVVLQQLQQSMQSYAQEFHRLQERTSGSQQQEAGWSPWEVEVERNMGDLRERVTFERQGDPAALRMEIEAEVREELEKEYASRMTEVPQRSELERQIRNEVRQEYEERQRLQERLIPRSGEQEVSEQALRDVEARLRNEIEIQVRQDFLSQIMNSNGGQALPPMLSSNRGGAPFAESERDNTSLSSNLMPPPTAVPSTPPLPAPIAASKSSPTPYVGDFGEEAADIFRLEAEEHLQTIGMHVAALEKDPNNRDLIQGVRRAMHTLKGAAGMMGFRIIADLSHVSEDLLDLIMEGSIPISPIVVSLILDTAEALDLLITDNDSANGEIKAKELHARYAEFLGERTSSHQLMDEDLDTEIADEHIADSAQVSTVVSEGQSTVATTPRLSRGELSVRVRLQKLDELVNLFGEMLVNRSILEERIQRLVRQVADVAVSSNRLGDVGQKLESRFEAATLPSGRSVQVMPGEGDQHIARNTGLVPVARNGSIVPVPSHLSEFDELELDRYTEFHQLARGLSEGISDMATLSTEMDTIIRECESVFARENRLNTTFQDRLMKVRLVPLSTMAPRLYRAARAVALKQGKDIDFILEGETTEVDRTVYEEIAGPLLHLVRNAVNHAIERPEVRLQRGKPPKGEIKLSASYDGNQIVIEVRDDGNGIDRENVRQTAIARGLIRSDQQIGEDDVVSLIFRPGFSTAEVLSEESGRGVGLDVVRDSVSRLRGTLVVESTPGAGTAFTMTFPTSLAIQSAMMVRVAGQQFAIPTANVESIGRLDIFKRSTSYGQQSVIVRGDSYPLHHLAQYLGVPVSSMIDEKAQLLLVNAGGHRVALIVDEIKGKSDIVMKNLGPHLVDVHGIAGGTVLGNGQVVLILALDALLSSTVRANVPQVARTGPTGQVKQRVDVSASKQNTPVRPTATTPTTPERGKHILVVDDSPSVRRVVSNMLKQRGWAVQMARDGVEALEMISYETPAAVLLDIEMPRMDGYELISTIRAQEQYRTLPLVVLTSRAAAKHQQRAMSLGASSYVVKPYQDDELLNTINALVYGTVAH